MSYESKEQIFLYHGYGSGVGGYLERYGSYIRIPTVGSAALPNSGGEVKTESGPWEWSPDGEPPDGFRISVRGVHSRLWTEETATEWITNAEIAVSGFNLCNRVEVGRMVTRLQSVHKKGREKPQPRISFKGSGFWNGRIDDEPVGLAIDQELDEYSTYDELNDVVCGRKKTSFCPSNLSAEEPGDGKPDYFNDLHRKYKSDKHTRCSIVGEVQKKEGSKLPKPKGYSIELDGFGRIFFGEMVVSHGMKTLNMIRWDLGCTDCGGGDGGSGSANGEPMP